MADLSNKQLARLNEWLPDLVSRPGDERYNAATEIWAKPTGRLPQAVVHCRTTAHVQAAVRAVRDIGLPLSVLGGGHDWAGRALCEGVVIDLSGVSGVVVYPRERTAHVAGGTRIKDIVATTDTMGLAPVTGTVGAVGMAGLTLGGGYGPLIGRFGLALDNLIGAEVVLADGRMAMATANDDEDLFWALRGGGGNFGVVTALHLRVHDLPTVHSGLLAFPIAEARSILSNVAEMAASLPDELNVQVGCVVGPHGTPFVIVVPTWSGAASEGHERVAPFLKLGTLLAGTLEAMPYGAALRYFDAFVVKGQRTFVETCWLPALDGRSTEAFVQAMEMRPSAGCAIVTHEFKGAASRVPADATAFGLRRDHVLVEIIAAHPDRSDEQEEERHRQWASATRAYLEPMALPGGYPNMLASNDLERATKAFGANADRLAEIKRRYDPENVFRSTIPLPVAAQ